jgi:hypothetical protein
MTEVDGVVPEYAQTAARGGRRDGRPPGQGRVADRGVLVVGSARRSHPTLALLGITSL